MQNTTQNNMPNNMPNTTQKLIEMYMKSLSPTELKALEIAKTQLESSFDIEKSIGYLNWLNDYRNSQ